MSVQRYYWRVSGMKDISPGLAGVGIEFVLASDYDKLERDFVTLLKAAGAVFAWDGSDNDDEYLKDFDAFHDLVCAHQAPTQMPDPTHKSPVSRAAAATTRKAAVKS